MANVRGMDKWKSPRKGTKAKGKTHDWCVVTVDKHMGTWYSTLYVFTNEKAATTFCESESHRALWWPFKTKWLNKITQLTNKWVDCDFDPRILFHYRRDGFKQFLLEHSSTTTKKQGRQPKVRLQARNKSSSSTSLRS